LRDTCTRPVEHARPADALAPAALEEGTVVDVVRPLAQLLRSAQGTAPDDVVATLVEGAAQLDGTDVVLYLVDYAQRVLTPTPDRLPHGEMVEAASIDGTMAGRCFTSQEPLEAPRPDGSVQMWVPVTERAQRLGVLAINLPRPDEAGAQLCVELGLLAAQLVLTASLYTDRFHLQRRRRGLSLAAEMQWSLLPPLAFTYAGTTVAGLLEPAYEVGGDCFDYALNGSTLSLALFDAMGHGLASSILGGLTVGAYRHGRRERQGLVELLGSVDRAVAEHGAGDTFVTGLIVELETTTGELAWLSAGHPPPLVVRAGRALADVERAAGLPLGLGTGADASAPTQLTLEPGDRVLLYTDGVVEARTPEGEEFGVDRLADLMVREGLSGQVPAEILRRLVQACREWQGGRLRDDATLLLLDWEARTPLVGHQRLG
jgi:serine phosphatase RsbU (regulator of sigma subunit)